MSRPPVVIAGGTGLVGRGLLPALAQRGHPLRLLRHRNRPSWLADLPDVRTFAWDGQSRPPNEALDGAAAIVNLAGAGIADRRWSTARKEELRGSRLGPTRALAEAAVAHRVATLISASGIAGYGTGSEPADEQATFTGGGFLGDLARDWEAAAAAPGVRVVRLRIGVVLSGDGGALMRMVPPLGLPLTPLGDGRQVLPWIHRDDLVALVLAVLDDARYSGPVNAVAPEACDNRTFLRTLARVIGRFWVPLGVPGLALRLVLGELAGLVLDGRPVVPAKAASLGFGFIHSTAEEALSDIFKGING